MLLFYYLVIILPTALSLKCPSITFERYYNRYEILCWNGEGAIGGCCSTGFCWKFMLGLGPCECESRCQGWSIDFSGGNKMEYGRDDECKRIEEPISSATTKSSKSCAILWEKFGCFGKKEILDATTIWNLKDYNFSSIQGVSGCSYLSSPEIRVTLYQHYFFAPFGEIEEIFVKSGECRSLSDWWENRVSMIRPGSNHCYKVWEYANCRGASYCDCGKFDLNLKDLRMSTHSKKYWDDKVASVSSCDFKR